MRLLLLLMFILIAWPREGVGQQFREPDYYYASPQVSQDAKDCYAKLFDINNSPKTYSILDSAFTKNDDTRPFYIYLICSMLESANGDLREQMNIICRHLLEQKPNAVTAVLFSKQSIVTDKMKENWAHRVGVEIRITCDDDLMNCFKKSRTRALSHCDIRHKAELENMYNYIRKDMNLFQQR